MQTKFSFIYKRTTTTTKKQRKFCMVIRLIYRSKLNPNIPAYSHTLKVGHIDCVKDTRVVLDRTIGGKINEGCKALFGKFIVLNRENSNVSIHDESPLVINQVYDLNFIALHVMYLLLVIWLSLLLYLGRRTWVKFGAPGACYLNSNGPCRHTNLVRNGL